jgi:hypothetical protein
MKQALIVVDVQREQDLPVPGTRRRYAREYLIGWIVQ